MKRLILLLIFILVGCGGGPTYKIHNPNVTESQATMNKVPTFVQWREFNITSALEENKIPFVYFYENNTNSKRMNVTLANPAVHEMLNKHFYCSKMNLEDELDWFGSVNLGVESGPSIAFAVKKDEETAKLFIFEGYLSSTELLKLLEFFHESRSGLSQP